MSRFIAIANQKGGVGKTTTTVNLAASLAQLGRRVLVLDMDPQGNASSGFGVSANALQRGVYEVLMGSAAVQEAIYPQASPGVDLLPSGQRLIGAEVELVSALARERILEKCIQPIRNQYDLLLADCPPSLGLLTVNTLTAADSVLIPIQCEYYALEGVTQLMNAIRLIQQALNPRLDIEGILLTMFDARLNLSREVMVEARKFFSGKVYETVIPRNVRLSEAPSFGKPVLQYDPECAGAQFYLKLAHEVLGLPPDADASTIKETEDAHTDKEMEAEYEHPRISSADRIQDAEPEVVEVVAQSACVEDGVEPVEVSGVEPVEVSGVEPVSATRVDRTAETVEALPAEPVDVVAVETVAEPVSFNASDTRAESTEATDSPAEVPPAYAPPSARSSFDAIAATYTEDVAVAVPTQDAPVPAVETEITSDEIIVLSEDAIVVSSETDASSERDATLVAAPIEQPRAIEDERPRDPQSEPTSEAHPQEELVSHD